MLLQFNGCGIVSDNFGNNLEGLYRPGHTHLLAGVPLLRIPELGPVAAEDHDREYLVGVGLVEVDERWLALA